MLAKLSVHADLCRMSVMGGGNDTGQPVWGTEPLLDSRSLETDNEDAEEFSAYSLEHRSRQTATAKRFTVVRNTAEDSHYM